MSDVLFQTGIFKLAYGETVDWKIECDVLGSESLATMARLLVQRLPAFGAVLGVPTGGLPLARHLVPYITGGPMLLVDDVLTTGGSMEALRTRVEAWWAGDIIGAVLFARQACPDWIQPLLVMPSEGPIGWPAGILATVMDRGKKK